MEHSQQSRNHSSTKRGRELDPAQRLVADVLSITVLCFFSVVSVYLTTEGLEVYHEGEATQNWATTSGRILKSYGDHSKRGRKKRKRSSYVAYLKYQYEVDGVTYKSMNGRYQAVAFSDRSETEVERFLEGYPVGKEITVYYDPMDPKESVLFPGATPEGPFLILFGTVVGIVCGFNWIRIGRRLVRYTSEEKIW